MFDQHLRSLLEVAVALVNTATDGQARGQRYAAPEGGRLAEAIDALLPLPGRTPGIEPRQADRLAASARRMRPVFEAVDAGEVDQAAEVLNGMLRVTGARPQLDRVGDEPWQLHFHGSDDSLAIGWSAGCATALAMAVGSDLAGRLGVCAAGRCDRVYIDTSRNAARQFCSTACQDRVKASAYRARKNAGVEPPS